MSSKKSSSKSKGAKSLSAKKASQVKGGVSLGSIIDAQAFPKFAGDGSVKTISSVKTIEWK